MPSLQEAYSPTESDLAQVGLSLSHVDGPLYRAKGCEECNFKGYRGRMGIYELLIVDDKLRAMVTEGADAGAIKRRRLPVA